MALLMECGLFWVIQFYKYLTPTEFLTCLSSLQRSEIFIEIHKYTRCQHSVGVLYCFILLELQHHNQKLI